MNEQETINYTRILKGETSELCQCGSPLKIEERCCNTFTFCPVQKWWNFLSHASKTQYGFGINKELNHKCAS